MMAIAGSLPYVFGSSVYLLNGMPICTPTSHEHTYNLALIVSTSLLYSIIPFIIVTSLNIAIPGYHKGIQKEYDSINKTVTG